MTTGINKHRLESNPLELRFAVNWLKVNRDNQILKYILDRKPTNRGDYTPTKTEEEVAATIIQWLGSPVGQGFMEGVMHNVK